jgi:hypothetical protein
MGQAAVPHIVLRSTSALAAAIYRVPAPGMANALGSPPFFHAAGMTVIMWNREELLFDKRLARGGIGQT